ncbi:two component transcriptional regulator, LuxR family [Nitrosospira multiformis]|uniref:Two component transcriptional regulator, LuxR family n=1 Tax=Nitrosospira multiformis TaxID=1231 RepID=A0A1H8EV68_9PROT|nr:response regulator transcription factor [Nitrosospira multiformis]SEN23369.1 two component transcriptional regulator, LuxR family [Nitrosospira multiformis]
MTNTQSIKIVIVEDHPPIVHALRDYLNTVPQFKVVGTAKNIEEARVVMGSNEVDLVIMDIRLPDEKGVKTNDGGIALTAEFSDLYPDLAILVYTADENIEVVRLSKEAGARGYVLKTSDIPVIKEAIDIVMAGGIYMDQDLPEVPKRPSGVALTPKEEQVLRLFGKWMTREQIAQELGIKLATVNCHCNNIGWKLELNGNTEFLREAIRRYGNPDVDGVRKMDKGLST